MRKIKNVLSVILAVSVVFFCLFACGGGNAENTAKIEPYLRYEIATTTDDFIGCEDYETDKDAIDGLYKAGFRNIDLSLYSLTNKHPYMQDTWRETILDLKNYAESRGMKFVQAHAQGGNGLDSSKADFIVEATNRSIEICEVLGIPNIVLHAGYKSGLTKEQWFEANKEFFERVLPTAERCKVNVLCENSTKANMGSNYYINTGKDMREFIKYVNNPYFHGCWDTGHANCEPDQVQNILDLGDEMYAIHYNDNTGILDEHALIGCGNLKNKDIINAIIQTGFDGYFTLECNGWTRNAEDYKGPYYNDEGKIVRSNLFIRYDSRLDQEILLFNTMNILLTVDENGNGWEREFEFVFK